MTTSVTVPKTLCICPGCRTHSLLSESISACVSKSCLKCCNPIIPVVAIMDPNAPTMSLFLDWYNSPSITEEEFRRFNPDARQCITLLACVHDHTSAIPGGIDYKPWCRLCDVLSCSGTRRMTVAAIIANQTAPRAGVLVANYRDCY